MAAAIVAFKATLTVRPKAMVGASIAATTVVTDQYGRPVANWTVALQKMQKGTATWKWVKSVRTSATGTALVR